MASSQKSLHRSARPQGRVRWRRFALMLVPALGAGGILVGLTASGVLASSISVSGQPFTVTASNLSGGPFAQYGAALPTAQGTKPVAVSVIGIGKLTNLCQSVSVGGLTLRLTAGGGGNTPVSANNLVVAADTLSGDATFKNITIGQDAGQMGVSGVTPAPTSGSFGEMADSVSIDNLRQNTFLTTAGTFTLPGLSLSFGNAC
jgi:Family of unknown function (DUF6230)